MRHVSGMRGDVWEARQEVTLEGDGGCGVTGNEVVRKKDSERRLVWGMVEVVGRRGINRR